MSYDNTNRGAVWLNSFRSVDTDPEYKGTVNVNGEEYVLRLWPKPDGSKPNAPDFTLTVRLKTVDGDDVVPF